MKLGRAGIAAAALWFATSSAWAGDGAAPATLTPAQIASRAGAAVLLVRTGTELGSGFVAGPGGLVATSLHVLAAGKPVVVVLPDGRKLEDLTVVATDTKYDLALLRAAGLTTPPLSLGDSGAARAGDRVVAIGHPFGFDHTVSDGLLSAVRKLGGLTVLQISAPISPGSSGGPLFNERGEVIGVATFASIAGQNLNFCVPVDALKPLLATKGAGTPIASWKAPERGGEAGLRAGVRRAAVSELDGCAPADLVAFGRRISDAIGEGAPLYNEGRHETCYRIYDSTARELVRERGAKCQGAAKILDGGLARAEAAPDATAKAWAMRDAFDSLADVILRSGRDSAPEVAKPRALPAPPPRHVLHHPDALLADCRSAGVGKLRSTLDNAINAGAPLYNDGEYEACFRIYEATSRALQDSLDGCGGAKRALAAGLREASGRKDPVAKAWALRDAFDGLLELIARVGGR